MSSFDNSNALEKILTNKLVTERKFDEIQLLNSREVSDSPRDAHNLYQSLNKQYKDAYVRDRNDVSIAMTIDKLGQFGSIVDALNKRLQDHIRMLKQNESSTKQPNAVLEYDMAKRKVDKLAEILRAKLVWNNAYQELQLLDVADIAMRYQKLVALQQGFEVLQKYELDQSKIEAFEKMKDEFLSWYSPATILAIDANDIKQLESIRDKYFSLGRVNVFESSFGNYARNKIKCFVEEEGNNSLWEVLQEYFAIWKRSHKVADLFIEGDGSELIANQLFDGFIVKWDAIVVIVSQMVNESENPFVAAKLIGKVLSDFSSFAQKDGDEHILLTITQICQRVFALLSADYGKYVTSLLLCTINKITKPEKSSRFRHNWLLPYLEEVQSCMREIANEAKTTFGSDFSSKVVPSFEQGVREINSLLQNNDTLSIRPEGRDIRAKKSIQENTEDKISAICVTGYLLNMIDDLNECICETTADLSPVGVTKENPRLISNASLLETLNSQVVLRKVESIANTIIYPMEEEMRKLVQKQLALDKEGAEANDELSHSLPSFSVAPQNYVTSIGHGLLSQLNTIGGYGGDRNFVRAISSAAADLSSATFSEDETDLWLLTEVAKLVQNAFCSQIRSGGQLPPKLRRQFNTDVVFLMEALSDLRLQPTVQLMELADKLKEN